MRAQIMLRASDIGDHSPHNTGNENDPLVCRSRWLNDSFPGLLLPDQIWGEAIKALRLWEEWSPTGLVRDPVFCRLLHNGVWDSRELGRPAAECHRAIFHAHLFCWFSQPCHPHTRSSLHFSLVIFVFHLAFMLLTCYSINDFHETLQLAEAYWPETAQLVHPARGGKLSLLAQNNSIQAVVQDAIPIVFRHIASVDSFPSGEDKVKVVRDSLYKAAENEGSNEITDRLSQDRNFGRWLSSLVRALTQPFQPYPFLSLSTG